MCTIHIIVAMTSDRVIGCKGQLPWDLPADLQLFRQHTLNKTVLMGKNTYLSIGHPLSQRNNIIISRTIQASDDMSVADSFSKGIDLAKKTGRDIYCIGGVEIYRQALPITHYLHISWVENDFDGDCYFPKFDLNEWREISRKSHDGFTHCSYTRKS